jgi:osmotically inducible protein OsmC
VYNAGYSELIVRGSVSSLNPLNQEEKIMQRKASAVWKGGLKDGEGTLSTHSGVLHEVNYSFGTRFEDAPGTNPEELVGAAHAGCFAMALSGILVEAGMKPERLEVAATVTIEKTDEGWTVTKSHLDLKGRVSGADESSFREAAEKAEKGCPVSRLLKAEITMNATLEQ